jgi:hypothetical protein
MIHSTEPSATYISDSTGAGVGANHPYTYYLDPPKFEGVNYVNYNIGVPGRKLSEMFALMDSIDPTKLGACMNMHDEGRKIVNIWGAGNDFQAGDSPSEAFLCLEKFCLALRERGALVIVTTLLSRLNLDSKIAEYNGLIREKAWRFAHGLADPAKYSQVGSAGASLAKPGQKFFQPDQIHPADPALIIVAAEVQYAFEKVNAGEFIFRPSL